MQHPNIVEFQVSGDYALFSDPIMRVGGEKCTYQVPTYEALKGILSSVYWKPTLIWYIDRVRVINRIRTEVKGVRPIKYNGGNDLSYYTYLKDCVYQVRAHFEWNMNRPELAGDRNENKHHESTILVFKAYSDETRNAMTARFWYPRMINGEIIFPRPEQCTITKKIHEMRIKPFGNELDNFTGLTEFEEADM